MVNCVEVLRGLFLTAVTNGGLQWPCWVKYQKESFSQFSQFGIENTGFCRCTAKCLSFACLLYSSSRCSHWRNRTASNGKQISSCTFNQDSQKLTDFLEFHIKKWSRCISGLCSSGHLQLLGFATCWLREQGSPLRNTAFHPSLAPEWEVSSSHSKI